MLFGTTALLLCVDLILYELFFPNVNRLFFTTMKHILSVNCLFFLFLIAGFAQEPVLLAPVPSESSRGTDALAGHDQYVQLYKDIAIAEMQRVGIPASIKLGQAILESSGGKSELATKANNHFGIKCGGGWNGKSFYKVDDERHANGEVKESCFRKYEDPEDSFFDHSDIIFNPKKAYIYGGLFVLEKKDYRAWARGLQAAGYATDPGYADKLIQLIERNQLYLYDDQVLAGKTEPASPTTPTPSKPKEKNKEKVDDKSSTASAASTRIVRKNDLKLVLTKQGEAIDEIARLYQIKVNRIVDYNEEQYTPGRPLPVNTKIYLQKKRSKWRGRSRQHYVRSNQTMFEISQEYGIQLEKLLERNRLQPGDEPMEGEQISLKGKPNSNTPIRLRNQNRPGDALGEEELFVIGEPAVATPIPERPAVVVNTPTSTPVPVPTSPVSTTPTVPTTPVIKEPTSVPPGPAAPTEASVNYHTVVKGDTLFNVSRRYGITIASLKALNGLTTDSIQIGQRLRIR